MFKLEVLVTLKNDVLDPQGKAVSSNMKNVGLPQISNVRIGKHIELEVIASDEKKASDIVRDACKKILANEIMESFEFDIKKS